jgi:hypothetical protein
MKRYFFGFLIGVGIGMVVWGVFLMRSELEIAIRDEYRKELRQYDDPILQQIKRQLDDMKLKRIQIDSVKVKKVEEFLTKHRRKFK